MNLILELDTPVTAQIRLGSDGPFVRLLTQWVSVDGAVTCPQDIDILYEDLGTYIDTLQRAKRAIEAYMILGQST